MNIHIKSILGAFAFSFLFYSKSLGLNVILFSIIVTILLSGRAFQWRYAVPYLLTAMMVFIDPSGFQMFVHFVALVVFMGKSIAAKSSLYLATFAGLINVFVGALVHWVNYTNSNPKRPKNLSPKIVNYLLGSVVSVGLLLLFMMLYSNANPVFSDILASIDLDFISLPWMIFTLLGYALFLNLLWPYYPTELIAFDAANGNDLARPTATFSQDRLSKLEREHTVGSMVLGVLNLLLVFFLITDVIYLLGPDITRYADYSNSVHQGVYALMFSIVVAIGIILYFFRGDLNFYEGNTTIKRLTYTWVILNLILVAFTFYKNYSYVEALGLTYKRIGVFVYLFITITGLATAFFKVSKTKNFMYLMRSNFVVVFAILICSAGVPWDRTITWYNLSHLEKPDVTYLLDLGSSNLVQLNDYRIARGKGLIMEQDQAINDRYQAFLKVQDEKTWQEYNWYQWTQFLRK